jgi:hypothetical protein
MQEALFEHFLASFLCLNCIQGISAIIDLKIQGISIIPDFFCELAYSLVETRITLIP